ncbi:hypothetical protein OF83DRAFT_872467 [Amylostereum chailletii]|nr:hypothetical protein OF83DRAFT_872467 [Amylostereum chailletii]
MRRPPRFETRRSASGASPPPPPPAGQCLEALGLWPHMPEPLARHPRGSQLAETGHRVTLFGRFDLSLIVSSPHPPFLPVAPSSLSRLRGLAATLSLTFLAPCSWTIPPKAPQVRRGYDPTVARHQISGHLSFHTRSQRRCFDTGRPNAPEFHVPWRGLPVEDRYGILGAEAQGVGECRFAWPSSASSPTMPDCLPSWTTPHQTAPTSVCTTAL